MLRLPNGKPIDEYMLEAAMEDSNIGNFYFLNMQTGEVVFISEYDGPSDEREEQLEEIDGSRDYVPIERISSREAYRWMEDFVAQIVAPQNEQVAEKLSIALMGRGAFRRFKDVLHFVGDQWLQAWYEWRDKQLKAAMKEWFESVLQEEEWMSQQEGNSKDIL
jgi:Uncharacterised protein family (UPF0158)